MPLQTVHQSSPQKTQTQQATSRFAARPSTVQAQRDFDRPAIQMADSEVQSLEQAARFGHHFANISVHSPDPRASASVQRKQVTDDQPVSDAERRPNRTGFPDHLKAGIESLSGLALDDVRVHYHSDKPAQLNALAYTQGTDIHVAPGQERHLAHEAWHVVQQAQGRVQSTLQLKDGVSVNDDHELEREADLMGARAVQMMPGQEARHAPADQLQKGNTRNALVPFGSSVVQRAIYLNIPALLAAIWPPAAGPVPNVAAFSHSLQELFQDAAGQLPLTDVLADPALGRIAEAGFNPAPPPAPQYVLNYHPGLGAGNPNFLIASMLHELLHISTQRNYRKNGVPYDFLNMNLPPGLAVPASVGNEVNAQLQLLDQNLHDAVVVTTADIALPVHLRNHVLDRLNNYARAMPDVHYDTVLADILAYLELNGINHGPTFDFIVRMINESTNRRLVDPWWGTQSARRVDRNKRFWQFWKW